MTKESQTTPKREENQICVYFVTYLYHTSKLRGSPGKGCKRVNDTLLANSLSMRKIIEISEKFNKTGFKTGFLRGYERHING